MVVLAGQMEVSGHSLMILISRRPQLAPATLSSAPPLFPPLFFLSIGRTSFLSRNHGLQLPPSFYLHRFPAFCCEPPVTPYSPIVFQLLYFCLWSNAFLRLSLRGRENEERLVFGQERGSARKSRRVGERGDGEKRAKYFGLNHSSSK